MIPSSKAVRPARLLRSLALAAALCGVLFAASLVIAPPASAEDVTIWSADLEVKTLNAAQDELGCSESTPFNGQCLNSNVLSDDDFSLHGNAYTITRIEDDGSELELTLDTALPSNVLKFLTLHVGDDSELAFEDARVSSSNKRYTWSSSPSWSLDDDVDLSITDSSGPSLVKNTSLDDNERNLFENGHRSAQAFTAGTWARVTLIGIGIGDEVDDDVEVTLHKGGGSNPGDKLKTLENPSSITADSVNVFTVPDGGIVLEASKTYFVVVKTTSSDRVAVSVTGPLSGGNAEDDGAAENWTIDNGSRTNRPSIGTWQASNQSMRIDVKGEVLLDPPTNPSARAVAPMRVTLEWDRTLPSPKGTIDRDDGYKIEWSADGSTSWTSLVNYTNQYVTDSDIWCTCYPTRFNDNTITPGTTRHYRVKAVDDGDESPWSDVVSATTPGLVDSDGGLIVIGAVESGLDALNDQKMFRIGLESGEYRFMIRGKAPKHRVIVTDPGGTEIENFVLVANNTLLPRFTTQAVGIHQVKISHGGSPGQYTSLNAGGFHFVLVPVFEPSLSELTFAPGEEPDGVVLNTYGDVDRFGLRVQPGKAYRVRVVGRENDPFFTAATPRIVRARPPSTTHVYNMGKPWVEGVTTAASSTICHEFTEPEKCEYQAFVIDLRGQTGAEQTWRIDVTPTARPRTRPYRVGIYSVLLDELSATDLAGVRIPLRAWFASQPTQHDGSERIKVRVAFSDVVDESPENVGEHSVSVDGGEVTSVRPVDGQATGGSKASKGARSAGGQGDDAEDREVVWELEIKPDSDEDVTVSLAAWRPCDETGAICTADGRTLSTAISTTVRGPDEATAPEPPAKPRGLSATASHDSVTLNWDDPDDDTITGYVILRRVRVNDTGGEFSVLVADTGTAATTYTDATVKANTTYTYRIKAINEHGVSERSRWSHIDIPAAPERPDKPTGLDATATHDQVVLTWDDPDDDTITGYVILRRLRYDDPSGHFDELAPDTGSAATIYTDDTVAAETNYTYRIKAINEHGVSERSRWFHIDTPAAPEAVKGDDQDREDGGGGAPGHATPPGPGGRANVSEPDGEDLPEGTTTTGEVDVGGSVTGNVDRDADVDWFRVELEADTRYQFDVEGADTGRGNLADPFLWGLYDAGGQAISGARSNDGGVGKNGRVIYTPTADGTYYIAVSGTATTTGTYTLSVIVLGANGVSEADTDFPADNTTSGRVDVGASVTGTISNGDYDYFRVDLEAGKTYQFDLEGADSGRGTLVDPFLSLYDGSATFLLVDDDSGTNLNSQMVYKAASAGAHYLRATTGAANLTGTYTLSVRDITQPLSTDATLSGLSLGTGVTLSPAFASGTVTYSVDEVTVTPTTNHASATVEILDTDDLALTDADSTEDGFQVALSVGDTVIKVKVTAADGSSTQTYTATVTRDDFPNDNTTTGEVEVGGTVTGNIGTVGDYDRFKVELEAGTRYQLDLEGADTSRGTLADPHLGLYDNIGNQLQGDNGQLGDDNSGVGVNARMIYTPDASGDFYPVVTEINDNRTGTYTLSVILLGANGASEADTDFPATTTTSGRVEVGGSVTGNRGSIGDTDWFAVVLEAGKTYQIDLTGEYGGGGTLKDPYLDNIRDSSGNRISNTFNNDVDFANDIFDSQIIFTPTAAGTYYLVAFGNGSITGTYTLSVRDITTPPCTLNTGDLWCGVVTVAEIKTTGDALVGHGFADGAGLSAGGLAGYPDATMFSVGDNDYTISAAYIQVPTGSTVTGALYVLLSADLTDDDKAGLVLTVDDTTTTFAFSGATKGTTGLYSWGLSGLSWSAEDTVTIRVRRPRTLSVADASDAENDGEVEFTVTLSEAATEEVTATWTASIKTGDTAAAADLGSMKTGTVTVAIGDTTETFTVPVVNDDADEGDETFTVTLSSPSTNAKLETDPTAKGTIEDDDPTPTVTVANAAATEGDAVEFVVTLSAVSGRDVMVDYATSVATGDDATSGVDFTTKSGTLTIAAADNTATGTIQVQTTEDDANESAETFTLTISNPDNATLTTDTTATGTINNRATAAVALVGNTTQTTTFEQTTVGSISFAVGLQIGDDDGGYALTALDLMFSAKPVVPVTVSLWDGYRPGGNDDGDDDWRPNNKYFEFDNPSAFKDGNNQINTFTPPEPFYLHDDRVYFVVIESDGSGSTEYYITNTDADGQSRVDSNWWILNSAVRYQDLSNPDDPWPDSVTQTPTRIPVFTIHGYDLDRLTYTTSESDQDNFKVGEDNYNWWAQSFNVIQGADSFIGFKLHSVALALEYIASADSGIPDSPDEIIVSLYTGKQEGGPSSDPVPDEKLFDFRDPPAFREGHDNAFTAPEGTTLRPQGRYAIVIQRLGGGWIRLRNTASNDQDGNSNIFVANESQKSRDGTNWSGENWVVKMLVYGKQRTEAIPLSTGPTTLSGLSLGAGVTLSPAFASGTVTYTASVANSVDEVTVTPTTNHASATVEILDTDDNELDDADDMEDDFQVALSVGDTVIKVKVTAEDSTATQTYTVTVTRDDFPNDNTTTGEVEVGGTVTGNIGVAGDGDWFKVELEAGTRYQIDLEGVDTGRGTLPDPAASLYATSLISGNDDAGVGNNARIINTPTATGTYYIAVSGAVNTTGTYTVSVIVLGANGASEADTDFPADNTTSGRVEVGASATGNIASTSDKDWFRVDLEAGKVYQIDLEGWPTGRGTLLDPYLTLLDGSGNLIENNDDISTANLNSQLVFTPTAAGTYYLVVETAAPTTGTYTLSVRDITQPAPTCTLNTGDIWCGVVTVAEIKTSPGDALVGHGFADGAGLSAGSLAGNPDETVFSVGDNDYTISAAYIQVPTGTTLTGTLYVLLSADLTDDDKAGLLLPVDGTTTPFEFSGATKGTTGLYSWGLSGLSWSAGDTVTIRVRPRTLSVADASDAENDGEVEFTVTLSEVAATAVTATWTASIETGDTAVAADLGSTKTGTVTVAIGDTMGTFEVPVVNDSTDEGDETFTVTLSSPSSNAKLETDPTATGTIEDDDETTLSTDATLSGLSLGMGVTLSPAFASGTATYTASVANSVDEVTVTPTTNHASATVEILDTDDMELEDADDMEDDFQVALSVGDTVIKVKVTAEDDTSTQTYTVTVTRAAEMTPDDPPDDSGNVPDSVTDLLSNLGQANNLNFAIAVGDFENAQGFTTGSDSYGYFLASINLDVVDTVPKTPADVTVSLWSATSDSPPEPDAPVATLTHSTGTWATGVNTFNAPGGTVLDPGTTYFVVQSYSGARAHLSLRPTASGSADDDSTGWSVAGARLTRSRTDLGDWSGQSGEYTKFSVSGAAVPAQGVAEGATDLPADTSTGGVVEVGGVGARGAIHEPIHRPDNYRDLDTDWFAVELKAGRTYRIDMKGAILTSPGPNNYADPELTLLLPQINAIYDADGDYLLNTWGADESSAHHLFRVTFHAHADGTYYIAASGESFEWGGYELTVIDIT